MQRPTANSISQGKHGTYNAVDFDNDPDPTIYAPEDGKVTAKFVDPTCGNSLQVEGATGRSGFCHAESYLVNVGDSVKRGQPLGKMGYTGYTQPDDVPAGAHLHWVLNINGAYVYPIDKVNQDFIKDSQEGDDEVIKNTQEDWTRWSRLHRQVTGYDLDKERYDRDFVGQTDERGRDMISNNAQADLNTAMADLGRQVEREKWLQNIMDLRKDNADLYKKLTESGVIDPAKVDKAIKEAKEAVEAAEALKE